MVPMTKALSVSHALEEIRIEGLRPNTPTLTQTVATNSTSSVAKECAIRTSIDDFVLDPRT